jgi:hypothetical protein
LCTQRDCLRDDLTVAKVEVEDLREQLLAAMNETKKGLKAQLKASRDEVGCESDPRRFHSRGVALFLSTAALLSLAGRGLSNGMLLLRFLFLTRAGLLRCQT